MGSDFVNKALLTVGTFGVNQVAGGALAVAQGVKGAVGEIKKPAEEELAATKAQMDKQQGDQQKLLDDAKRQSDQATITANANSARDAALAAERKNLFSAQGRGSTILTSPLGVTGYGSSPGKTLLGS